jgi:hypothetical protein
MVRIAQDSDVVGAWRCVHSSVFQKMLEKPSLTGLVSCLAIRSGGSPISAVPPLATYSSRAHRSGLSDGQDCPPWSVSPGWAGALAAG